MESISATDLLSLLGEEYLNKLGEELNVDRSVKKLRGLTLFKLLVYSFLSPHKQRISLRHLASTFEDVLFLAYAPEAAAEAVGWTGVRDRLCHINAAYFERIYQHVLAQATELYGEEVLGDYKIKRYDSTIIHTFSHLLGDDSRGMKVGKPKSAKAAAAAKTNNDASCPAATADKKPSEKRHLKITTEFSSDFGIRFDFHDEQSYLSEETALKEAILKKHNPEENAVVVFDNGLKARRSFIQFDELGVSFVTNLGKSPRYEVICPCVHVSSCEDAELEIVQDSRVQLYESGSNKPVAHDFRLVEVRVKSTGQHLFFLTNIWDLPAEVIAQFYRKRWEIEVLFRFLKQDMDLKNLPCYSNNAIHVVLYVKLIVAMLILIFKKKTT